MDDKLARILCIGGMHMDYTIQCDHNPILGESNPASTTKSFGGVAFNIAKLLPHLGFTTGIVSKVGLDLPGTEIIDYLNATSIDLVDVGEESSKSTATYTDILNAQGELIIGLADMQIYDLLDEHYWPTRLEKLRDWDAWCIDTNMPKLGLNFLLSHNDQARTYVIGSSPSKASRLQANLQSIDTLILNIAEANSIIKQVYEGLNGAEEVAKILYQKGVGRVIVTSGSNGAAWADSNGSGTSGSPNKKVVPLRTSGAGDTLAAVTIGALEKCCTTKKALELGLLASNFFISTPNPNMLITWQLIEKLQTNQTR
ncbi:MAG: hypothetical protein CL402_04075 [Acidiferrobacteraceae bacterium]|nr:hypothetical protein [Acidiferrobacteraceae bacterium]|tara:strand:+ start:150 stop:1088 length:939 start_codon:yes stop_codon:yes gene_type:complete